MWKLLCIWDFDFKLPLWSWVHSIIQSSFNSIDSGFKLAPPESPTRHGSAVSPSIIPNTSSPTMIMTTTITRTPPRPHGTPPRVRMLKKYFCDIYGLGKSRFFSCHLLQGPVAIQYISVEVRYWATLCIENCPMENITHPSIDQRRGGRSFRYSNQQRMLIQGDFCIMLFNKKVGRAIWGHMIKLNAGVVLLNKLLNKMQ